MKQGEFATHVRVRLRARKDKVLSPFRMHLRVLRHVSVVYRLTSHFGADIVRPDRYLSGSPLLGGALEQLRNYRKLHEVRNETNKQIRNLPPPDLRSFQLPGFFRDCHCGFMLIR